MFFDDPALRIVVQALNSGFLKTLQLFATTLVGAIPLGLIIACLLYTSDAADE